MYQGVVLERWTMEGYRFAYGAVYTANYNPEETAEGKVTEVLNHCILKEDHVLYAQAHVDAIKMAKDSKWPLLVKDAGTPYINKRWLANELPFFCISHELTLGQLVDELLDRHTDLLRYPGMEMFSRNLALARNNLLRYVSESTCGLIE